MENKALQLLGMARRAGKTVIGFDATVAAVKDNRASIVLFAGDLSKKTEQEWRFAVPHPSVPVGRWPFGKEETGHAIGSKKAVGIVAVADEGFAKALRAYINEEGGEWI